MKTSKDILKDNFGIFLYFMVVFINLPLNKRREIIENTTFSIENLGNACFALSKAYNKTSIKLK